MKPEPTFGWALSEPDSHGVHRLDIRSVRRTRAEVIFWARKTVRVSDAEKPWATLKRVYGFQLHQVEVEMF